MIRPFIYMLLVMSLVLGAIFGWKFYAGMQAGQAMASMQFPPVAVSTQEAQADLWQPTIRVVGSLRALQGVSVTAQLGGQITELLFESGQVVRAGDLLARQNTAVDEARLAGLDAESKLAEANLKRAEDLVRKELISDTDYDTRRTELQSARAAEQNLRQMIEQKSIRAPFAGRLGIREVDLGQYLEPGDPVVRLESFERILIEFTVPQKQFGLLKVGQTILVTSDAWPGREFSGEISAIDPQISRQTRSVLLQGVIANTEEQLLPGMFVQARVVLPEREAVVTVPQSAVTYSPYGDSVFIVTPADSQDGAPTVRSAFVRTGETRGDQVAIESGLEAGDVVVTAGQQKLRNGSSVRIDNSVAVNNAADPQPANN